MTPPRWVDADGKQMATWPCHVCSMPVPVGHTYRLERMIGWQLFPEVSFVDSCGHAQHCCVVVPHVAGERAGLVPIPGEAA